MFVRRSSLEVSLVHALVAAGWERSYDRPPRVEPWRGRLIRVMPNGWAAVLQLEFGRAGDEAPHASDAGFRESVEVGASLTLPEAERLAAAMKVPVPSDLALEMPEPPAGVRTFSMGASNEVEDPRRRVMSEVLQFAEDVVMPWAALHASADGWIAAQSAMRDEFAVGFHGEYAPTVLVASNRSADALEHLRLAERHPEFHDDDPLSRR